MAYSRDSNGTEKAISNRKKWDAEHLKRCSLAMDKDLYEKAKAAAEEEGKSFNKFICDCIAEHINR